MRIVNNNVTAMMQFKSPTKRPKPSEDVQQIYAKLDSGMEAKDLSEEEFAKLVQFEEADKAAAYQGIFEDKSKGEALAKKVAKGEPLTPEEEALLNERYPHLKKEAEQAKKEGEELKKRLKSAKSESERQMMLSTATSNIASMSAKGLLSSTQVVIKMEVIKQVAKEVDEEGDSIGEVDFMKTSTFKPGTFFDTRG